VTTYTLIHVVLSLVGIASGLVVVLGLIAGKRLRLSNALFLGTTAATSITGYGFPFDHLLPSHIVGAVSLIVLALAIYAYYVRHLAGRWRVTYVISAVAALYFNCFVLVVQAFLKVPALNALAPTQSEPPFAIAQLAVLALFIVLGFLAVRRSKGISPQMRPGVDPIPWTG
jgi:hypothetical protein